FGFILLAQSSSLSTTTPTSIFENTQVMISQLLLVVKYMDVL
ncbi:MAG: hypothetical protein ACI8PD_002393, partial [Nitrospinales bacterium]